MMRATSSLSIRGIAILSIFSISTFLLFLTYEHFTHTSIRDLISNAVLPSSSRQENGVTEGNWDLDIVISHYGEDLKKLRETLEKIQAVPSVRKLKRRVILYTKNKKLAKETKAITRNLNITTTIYLPNEGREGGTYLHHIINNYDTLAPHTLFLQANPHDLKRVLILLKDHFYEHTGALSLGPYGTCDCRNCKDPWSEVKWHRIGEIYTMSHESFCPPQDLLLAISGQMVASRENIRTTKLKTYEKIYDTLRYRIGMDPQPKWLSKEGIENPFLGHGLERSWMVLFDCIKPEIAKTCKLGKNLGRDSCQCINKKAGHNKGRIGW
ncbi:hypothetical protein H072_11325 [Dactylellina haptotyla CBS 200.50]|uniref:Uncharacterized protein n=1 Tax=Dactylellina haptotyla (strain CBS 200.50) TaxID=1284197 RepID=S8B8K9_DACHA|nr:hypothetical protein H072_11325 [Dactylellina haptotyla CBS 200.50]